MITSDNQLLKKLIFDLSLRVDSPDGLTFDEAFAELDQAMTEVGCSDDEKEKFADLLARRITLPGMPPPNFILKLIDFVEGYREVHNTVRPRWCAYRKNALLWDIMLASGYYGRVFVFGSVAIGKALHVDTMTPYRFIKLAEKDRRVQLFKHSGGPLEANQYRLLVRHPDGTPCHIDDATLAFWDEVGRHFPFLRDSLEMNVNQEWALVDMQRRREMLTENRA